MNRILSFFFLFPLIIYSQNDTCYSINEEIISINEQGINDLINKYEQILKKRKGVNGWKVQLQFKDKEEEILKIKLKFIKLYPEIPVLLEYEEPYYRIRVGNCRTKLEAVKIQNMISKHFPNAYPVPEIINFSQLNK